MILVPLGKLAWDERGISAVEFALLAFPLSVLLLGSLDMGHGLYVRAVTLGALERATRATTLQNVDSTTVENNIRHDIREVIPAATVTIVKGSFYQYNQINAMERLTVDINGNGVLDGPVDTDGNGVADKSDCWEDVDDNGSRNTVTTGRDGIGGADDIVRYNVTVTYGRLLPMYGLIGLPSTATLQGTTMVRRQPYQGQGSPTVRCRT